MGRWHVQISPQTANCGFLFETSQKSLIRIVNYFYASRQSSYYQIFTFVWSISEHMISTLPTSLFQMRRKDPILTAGCGCVTEAEMHPTQTDRDSLCQLVCRNKSIPHMKGRISMVSPGAGPRCHGSGRRSWKRREGEKNQRDWQGDSVIHLRTPPYHTSA